MRTPSVVAGLLLAASSANAQNKVSVAGIAYDSLHARPLAGAMVGIIGTQFSAITDSAGRFLIENVPAGTYRFAAQHDVIDAIGMSAIGTSAKITDGKETVRLYVPSFSQLWKVVCGPTPPTDPDSGFVFGSVRPAPGMKSVAGAVVSASWLDLVAQGITVQQKLKTLEVNADSTGNFALCGVPTSMGIGIRASTDSAESGLFALDPMDKERVARRDVRLGMLLSNVVAAKRGATLNGKVMADSGVGPVSNAEVSLEEMGIKTTTNDKGEYTLGDILPGTHTVHVKRIGFAEAVARIDVEEADVRQRDFMINKVTILDSVGVTAKPSAREEQLRTFEEHRRLGNGKFVTREELLKAGEAPLTTILSSFNGLNIVRGAGGKTALLSKRGIKSGLQSGGSSCPVMVYLDGVLQTPQPDMSEFTPKDLEGIEYYAGASRIPIEYNKLGAPCGVLVLHSHWKK